MEFRLLGPVEAWTAGRQVDLGPRKQRLAMALLALAVNRPVPVDRLVDMTWPERPPRTARHAIHVSVSRLRGTLAEAGDDDVRIVTRGPTYCLKADPMCVDAHRFRAMVATARDKDTDAERGSLLGHALALWHGPALADVALSPAGGLCRGLEEARLMACEEWLDAELRLGRHGAIVDQLVELAAQHPYRQRLVGLLMLALYRDGRAPEALAIYRFVRRRLADEFGIDPHTELQDLERALLRADPALQTGHPLFPPVGSPFRASQSVGGRYRTPAPDTAPTPATSSSPTIWSLPEMWPVTRSGTGYRTP